MKSSIPSKSELLCIDCFTWRHIAEFLCSMVNKFGQSKEDCCIWLMQNTGNVFPVWERSWKVEKKIYPGNRTIHERMGRIQRMKLWQPNKGDANLYSKGDIYVVMWFYSLCIAILVSFSLLWTQLIGRYLDLKSL